MFFVGLDFSRSDSFVVCWEWAGGGGRDGLSSSVLAEMGTLA